MNATTKQIAQVQGTYRGAISVMLSSVFMVKVKEFKPLSMCLSSVVVRSACGNSFKVGREYTLLIREDPESNNEWVAVAAQA